MNEKWTLTEIDFKNARILLEEEKIFPVNEENMFRAGIYCIISAADKYQKHKVVYNKLLEGELDTPKNIEENKERFKEIVKKTRFPNTKIDRIFKFARWWSESDLAREIIEDINKCREKEFKLRNQIAEETPGLWYKGASLFMIKCGYENVVPIDLWMLRYLKDMGYDVAIPDYKKQSGPKPKEYLEYEKHFQETAGEHEVSPALLQFAIWSKRSTWNKKK